MKAMILAAGFGTRLRPFTETIPKPLFPLAGRPLVDRLICSLRNAGCEAVIINTHHLSDKTEAFIAARDYGIPVQTRYEPVILGTGGAIKNVSDFWDDRPFMVINSDIVTDIDLRKVYEYHLNQRYPVTMVLYDDPELNTVSIDKDNVITRFYSTSHFSLLTPRPPLTFTGIQVINPEVLDLIPPGVFSSSIKAYQKLMDQGEKIKAFIPESSYWKDIGTPERYKAAVLDTMAPEAFKAVSGFKFQVSSFKFQVSALKGDGSDRRWYRVTSGNQSLVLADHGIKAQEGTSETDAFVNIGHHLYARGIPVPKISLYDIFSGLVFLEDLGDLHLQAFVRNAPEEDIIRSYQTVIDHLIQMSISGAEGFDPSWTYQTPAYTKELILEKECRYFVDAFLNGYLGLNVRFERFREEFEHLADQALEFAVNGFMHRDMQSRNIMVRDGRFYFIDFQGGRIGPIQYDLASLLIDPYVSLPFSVQSRLADYAGDKLSGFVPVDPERFRAGLNYCRMTRNLQILGAFGYLSRVKGKTYFEAYIPIAMNSLKHHLAKFDGSDFPELKGLKFEI